VYEGVSVLLHLELAADRGWLMDDGGDGENMGPSSARCHMGVNYYTFTTY
jgi:hypothetical protein